MITRTVAGRALICGLLAFSVCATRSAAPARAKSAAPIVLRQGFERVGIGDWVLATGAYVYLASPAEGPCCGTVINDRTGQRTAFVHPDCGPFVFGGPWLLAECVPPVPASVGLEELTTGAWLTFTAPVGEHPVAAGADWIEFMRLESCSDYCRFAYTFENIRTGTLRTIPYRGGGRTIPDLNTPTLARRLCSPLRLPRGPGSMTF
jgi:hypothetical protein